MTVKRSSSPPQSCDQHVSVICSFHVTPVCGTFSITFSLFRATESPVSFSFLCVISSFRAINNKFKVKIKLSHVFFSVFTHSTGK